MASFVCYRFQCPRYPDCALAAGKGCCIERDPDQQEVPEGACTKEKEYPFLSPAPPNPVHAWLRRK